MSPLFFIDPKTFTFGYAFNSPQGDILDVIPISTRNMAPEIKLAILIIVALVTAVVLLLNNPSFGGKIRGNRLKRIHSSPNYGKGKFKNSVSTDMNPSNKLMFRAITSFIKGDKRRKPEKPLPNLPIDKELLNNPVEGVGVTWLGHSTYILTINGIKVLVDPVLSKRAAPFSFSGPKAFPYTNPYPPEDLPTTDILLVTHDHYDHLDYKTILELQGSGKIKHVITTLGVGAHLEKWGVAPGRITELDWWETTERNGLVFTATPSRHFSGRGLGNRFSTLWASFVIKSKSGNLFIGGDSGYYEGFREIGEKFGPFDLTILECGQYGEAWPYIHMMPEQTVRAHLDLKGKVLLPVHWGKFSLSLHPWTEPVERLLKSAEENDADVVTPKIGETFFLGGELPGEKWWR